MYRNLGAHRTSWALFRLTHVGMYENTGTSSRLEDQDQFQIPMREAGKLTTWRRDVQARSGSSAWSPRQGRGLDASRLRENTDSLISRLIRHPPSGGVQTVFMMVQLWYSLKNKGLEVEQPKQASYLSAFNVLLPPFSHDDIVLLSIAIWYSRVQQVRQAHKQGVHLAIHLSITIYVPNACGQGAVIPHIDREIRQ